MDLLLLTSHPDPGSVLPSLSLLAHAVRSAPADVSALLTAESAHAVLVDARTEQRDWDGLARVRRALLESEVPDKGLGFALLDRVEAAAALLRAGPAPLARWLGRLHAALGAVGMLDALAGDAAGRMLLDLLEERRTELSGNASPFSFNAWRDWLDREFEAASFRDGGIVRVVEQVHDKVLVNFDLINRQPF